MKKKKNGHVMDECKKGPVGKKKDLNVAIVVNDAKKKKKKK